jgi:hypothetical protein
MKKDLISQRLTEFGDDASLYNMWRGTLKNIVSEALLSLIEEVELLLRWLRPESITQTNRIRRSNPNDTDAALSKYG